MYYSTPYDAEKVYWTEGSIYWNATAWSMCSDKWNNAKYYSFRYCSEEHLNEDIGFQELYFDFENIKDYRDAIGILDKDLAWQKSANIK